MARFISFIITLGISLGISSADSEPEILSDTASLDNNYQIEISSEEVTQPNEKEPEEYPVVLIEPELIEQKIIDYQNIKSIDVEIIPVVYDKFNLTDEKDIQEVVDFINELTVNKTDPPPPSCGGGYIITFFLDHDTEKRICIDGNSYLHIGDDWYDIPYEEAIVFDCISSKFVMRSLDENNDYKTITGTVKSVKKKDSGGTKSCYIENCTGRYLIDFSESESIIDTRGNGCLVLQKNDVIKVKYKNIKNEKIIANVIFILKEKN